MSENGSIYQSPYSSQYRYRRRWVPKGVALLAILFVVGLLGACHSSSQPVAEIAVPVDAEGFVHRADGASITGVASVTKVASITGVAGVTKVASVAGDVSVIRATTGASVTVVAGVSSWKGLPGQDWSRAQQQAMVLNTF